MLACLWKCVVSIKLLDRLINNFDLVKMAKVASPLQPCMYININLFIFSQVTQSNDEIKSIRHFVKLTAHIT